MTKGEIIDVITSNIHSNSERKITGDVLQDVLIKMLEIDVDSNDVKFQVAANTTKKVNILKSSEKYKIQYYIDSISNPIVKRMGTIHITDNSFDEINVTGNIKNISFLYNTIDKSISVCNETNVNIEVVFKISYF